MKSLIVLLSFLIILVPNLVHCDRPMDICRMVYRFAETARYLDKCRVECNVYGQPRIHQLRDGEVCGPSVQGYNYLCNNGQCLPTRAQPIHHHYQPQPIPDPRPQPPPEPRPQPPLEPRPQPPYNLEEQQYHHQQKRLTFNWIKANLNATNLNVYLTICVLDNMVIPNIQLPLQDNYWTQRCHSCSSDVKTGPFFHWQTPCRDSERYPINGNSQIIFELWSYDRQPQFLSGIHIRLNELLLRRRTMENHTEMTLPLSFGPYPGQLQVAIGWN